MPVHFYDLLYIMLPLRQNFGFVECIIMCMCTCMKMLHENVTINNGKTPMYCQDTFKDCYFHLGFVRHWKYLHYQLLSVVFWLFWLSFFSVVAKCGLHMFVVCFMKRYSDFSSTGVISIISDDSGCGYWYILCPVTCVNPSVKSSYMNVSALSNVLCHIHCFAT